MPAALLTFLLVLSLPGAPAHEKEGAGQWEVECFDPSPTSPSLTHLRTQNLFHPIGEMDAAGDLLVVSKRGYGGFAVYSTSDPATPSLIGNAWGSKTTLDVKLSEDGQHAYVGTFGAIYVYDISSPSSPSQVRTVGLPVPQVDQGHMLYTALIDGDEYVFAASQSGSGVYIFKATGSGFGRDLTLVAQFAPGSPLAAHDMWVQDDPKLGIPVLYVANGFGGWIAADVSDPSTPLPLAVVPNPDPGQSYVHTVQAQWIDDRRIVVTISELGANIMRVWDATVLAAPVLLGTWSAPTDLPLVPSATSQHNIQIVDGQLFMAHYRCGFYVFDLRGLPVLPLIGQPAPGPIEPVAHYAPRTSNGQHWDVVIKDGYIYTSDMLLSSTSGAFHVVAYDGLALGDSTLTSTG